MKNIFSERLTILIKEKKMSKRELAREIGVSAMSVSDWSTGKIQPTAENIYLIAEYFSISSDYLLGLEDESGRKTYINNYGKINNISNNNFNNFGDINF